MSFVTINDIPLKTVLLQLQQALNPTSIHSELDAAGNIGLQEARRLVKVDTGELQGSTYTEVRGNDTVAIGATAEHGPYVEYGTSKQNAQPFIEPAAQLILKTLEQSLQKKINKF